MAIFVTAAAGGPGDPQSDGYPGMADLLTAKAQRADRRALNQLGVAGNLANPFDPITLSDQMAAMLTWSEDTS